jgi:hypothetical protein
VTRADRRLMGAFLAPTPLLLGVFLYGPMIGTTRDGGRIHRRSAGASRASALAEMRS